MLEINNFRVSMIEAGVGKGWSVRKISLEGLFLQEDREEKRREEAQTKRFSRFTLVYFQSNFVTSRNDVEDG